MSVNISRVFRFSDGFKFTPAMLEAEIQNIVDTINNANAGLLTWDNVVSTVISLTGVIPVANGGTNSSTALANNRFIVSSGDKIVENAAVTASRAVVTDANGLPSASATTAAEIAHVNGVTSAIQTQLNAKAPSASPTFTGTVTTPVTASRALVTGASSELAASATTATELGYVNGVTSAIQTQLNAKAATSAIKYYQVVQGTKTTAFSTTSSTYQDTGLTASITPSSTSNKVKITVSCCVGTADGTTSGAILTVKRGSTDLSGTAYGFVYGIVGSAVSQRFPASIVFLDSPSTTSATTYTVFLKNEDSATGVTLAANLAQANIVLEEVA